MTTATEIESVAEQLGITMECKFVPFSQSRNAGEKSPSLNWKVTLRVGGRDMLTTDYTAGCGHCPAYKADVKVAGGRNSILRDELIRDECEKGKSIKFQGDYVRTYGPAILPNLADVLHSLASDADVLDHGTFEEWAHSYGYDIDSRKAEGIYRVCLEIALKLRSGLGEQGLATLREAVQDY